MPPGVRKAALVAHVGSSVGWLGAVGTSLVLGVIGLTSGDAATVQAVYLVLEPVGWYALIPLSLAALLTGLVQSLGTAWGLIRHYWVLAKLLINLLATGVLLLYTQTWRSLAQAAATATSPDHVRDLSPVVHAAAALILLVVALTLSVYKPRGMTGYGLHRSRPTTTSGRQAVGTASATPIRRGNGDDSKLDNGETQLLAIDKPGRYELSAPLTTQRR